MRGAGGQPWLIAPNAGWPPAPCTLTGALLHLQATCVWLHARACRSCPATPWVHRGMTAWSAPSGAPQCHAALPTASLLGIQLSGIVRSWQPCGMRGPASGTALHLLRACVLCGAASAVPAGQRFTGASASADRERRHVLLESGGFGALLRAALTAGQSPEQDEDITAMIQRSCAVGIMYLATQVPVIAGVSLWLGHRRQGLVFHRLLGSRLVQPGGILLGRCLAGKVMSSHGVAVCQAPQPALPARCCTCRLAAWTQSTWPTTPCS